MDLITITDVTLREFGQNVGKKHLSAFHPEKRVKIARSLISAGFRQIEVFSCVSPRVAPAMSRDYLELIAKSIGRCDTTTLVTLVPNQTGYRTFLSLGLGPDGFNHAMGVFFSAVEAHNLANLRKTIKESMDGYVGILDDAARRGILTIGYISAAFGYRGGDESMVRPNASQVRGYIDFFIERGCSVVTLSDLQGVADPLETKIFLEEVMAGRKGHYGAMLGYHPHHYDPSKAIENTMAALEAGIRRLDSSIGGSGGCVTGAPGNQPTERLVEALEERGYRTGIDLEKLKALAADTAKSLYLKIQP